MNAIAELTRRGDALICREELGAILRHFDPLRDDPAVASCSSGAELAT
jgi:hypothetical protein